MYFLIGFFGLLLVLLLWQYDFKTAFIVFSTTFMGFFAFMGIMTYNQGVEGSSPSGPTHYQGVMI